MSCGTAGFGTAGGWLELPAEDVGAETGRQEEVGFTGADRFGGSNEAAASRSALVTLPTLGAFAGAGDLPSVVLRTFCFALPTTGPFAVAFISLGAAVGAGASC